MRRVLAYCIFMSLSAAAYAQIVLQFDVKAQPLTDALRIIAAQTNTNILYDPSLVAGRKVVAFRAQSTLDDALVQLLDGTGLKHQYVNEKTVTLVRPEAQLIRASSSEIKSAGKSVADAARPIATSAAK
jgi:iron complex outermembrane receptor protein